MKLLSKVIRTIYRYEMVSPGEHIVVGVSGGADSLALLTLLHSLQARWQLKLTAAHLDHGIRGARSQQEMRFVRGIADRMGVRCIAAKRDVLSRRAEKGLSLQAAAREERYRFYAEVMKRVAADRIALGHHADDQAETVLMRMLRGASTKGLGGIPPVRDGIIIRPLIEATRKEIEDYLEGRGIDFVPDSSADEPHYLRNKIRHQLIPLLQREYNPQAVTALGSLAELANHDNEILEDIAAGALEGHLRREGGNIRVRIEVLRRHGRRFYGRLLRHIIAALKGDTTELGMRHMEPIARLIDSAGASGMVQLPGGWRVRREYGDLVFGRSPGGARPFCFELDSVPGRIFIEEPGWRISLRREPVRDARRLLRDKPPNVEYLDALAAVPPIVVRSWEPGDRFYPLGLGGCKKLQDFFTDLKVPAGLRQQVPVMLCRGQIAWICGYRIDERFKLSDSAARVLRVSFDRTAPADNFYS